jgi:hypothetical protein
MAGMATGSIAGCQQSKCLMSRERKLPAELYDDSDKLSDGGCI